MGKSILRNLAILVVSLALTVANPADCPGDVVQVSATASYTHEQTKLQFPPSIEVKKDEPYTRGEVERYADAALGIAVGYESQGGAVATAYVYPVEPGDTIEAVHDRVIGEVKQVYRNVKVLESRKKFEATSKTKDRPFEGLYARMSVTMPSVDETHCSDLYLLRVGNYSLKFRISYPTEQKDELRKQFLPLVCAITSTVDANPK